MRTFDPAALEFATQEYQHEFMGFDAHALASNPRNIVLYNSRGDVALFEYADDSVVWGHYFFQSRGKSAVHSGTEFLHELFEGYPVRQIMGMTPLNKKGALWMNRRLGFRTITEIDTPKGLMRIVALSRSEWEHNKENIE